MIRKIEFEEITQTIRAMSTRHKLLFGLTIALNAGIAALNYERKSASNEILEWKKFKSGNHSSDFDTLLVAFRKEVSMQIGDTDRIPSLVINGSIRSQVTIQAGEYTLPDFLDSVCRQAGVVWELLLPYYRIKISQPEQKDAGISEDPIRQEVSGLPPCVEMFL
jgi:hypothetical protein